MAAIICKALAKPCEWCGEACSQCCKALNSCCSSLCRAFDDCCGWLGKQCNGCCSVFADCCSGCCQHITDFFARPFSGCVLFTVLINVVPLAVMAYFTGAAWDNPCDKPLHTWLLVMLFVFVFNLFFDCYVYRRISNSSFTDEELDKIWNPRDSLAKNESRLQMHFWQYDPVVACYILFGIFQLAWAIVGLVWSSDSKKSCEATSEGEQLVDATVASAIVLLCFVFLGVLGICLSIVDPYLQDCWAGVTCWKILCCFFYYPFCYKPPQRPPAGPRPPRDQLKQRFRGGGDASAQTQPQAQSHQSHPSHTVGVAPSQVRINVQHQPQPYQQQPYQQQPYQQQQAVHYQPVVYSQPQYEHQPQGLAVAQPIGAGAGAGPGVGHAQQEHYAPPPSYYQDASAPPPYEAKQPQQQDGAGGGDDLKTKVGEAAVAAGRAAGALFSKGMQMLSKKQPGDQAQQTDRIKV